MKRIAEADVEERVIDVELVQETVDSLNKKEKVIKLDINEQEEFTAYRFEHCSSGNIYMTTSPMESMIFLDGVRFVLEKWC